MNSPQLTLLDLVGAMAKSQTIGTLLDYWYLTFGVGRSHAFGQIEQMKKGGLAEVEYSPGKPVDQLVITLTRQGSEAADGQRQILATQATA